MLDSIKQKLKQINPIDSTSIKAEIILLLHENDREDMRILFTKGPQIYQLTLMR